MALESEIEVLKSVVTKLDSSLEKISEASNNIGRLLAVHNERLVQLEKTSDQRSDDIKDLNRRITHQTKEIIEKITSLEKTMEDHARAASSELKLQRQDIQKEFQCGIADLDDRLGILERWRWYIIGGAAAIGYLIGNLADIVKFLKVS